MGDFAKQTCPYFQDFSESTPCERDLVIKQKLSYMYPCPRKKPRESTKKDTQAKGSFQGPTLIRGWVGCPTRPVPTPPPLKEWFGHPSSLPPHPPNIWVYQHPFGFQKKKRKEKKVSHAFMITPLFTASLASTFNSEIGKQRWKHQQRSQ